MRRVPRRRHRLSPPRRARARGRDLHDHRPRQPQRHLREPQADRVGRTGGRRRAADRQVPPHLLETMSTTTATERRPEQRLHTIGAVCARLQSEYPDISISKIRYLEDQGLLTPKRTRGGYRLFSEEDVERLETILRLQRDEFLPLRVIRQELSAGGASAERKRRRPTGLGDREDDVQLAELCERADVS